MEVVLFFNHGIKIRSESLKFILILLDFKFFKLIFFIGYRVIDVH
jgi:hypothetical protein